MDKKVNATLIDWGAGQILHRVHRSVYRPDQFNPASIGSARFSPLIAADDSAIPTLYAGTTIDCALIETVFHDIPYDEGLKTLSKAAYLAGMVRSSLRLPGNLRLIDLSSIALRKLGITRSKLIDTDGSQYEHSRNWALTLYEQNEDAQGLIWAPRQDDQARALVLFESRFRTAPFVIKLDSEPLVLSDHSPCFEVILLARRLGVDLVP
jgi:hypothetical protein